MGVQGAHSWRGKEARVEAAPSEEPSRRLAPKAAQEPEGFLTRSRARAGLDKVRRHHSYKKVPKPPRSFTSEE